MEGVKKIKVGDIEVGLVGLDEIFKEVRALGIGGHHHWKGDALKEELLKGAKLYNWIREDREGEYKSALFSAYKEFCKKIDSERQEVQPEVKSSQND